ncbi:DUF2946 family protein [Alteraurantiacibacter aquimixticola]|uniref:DUF2946 domain-containing protein n=1 Tax=Alteraurantiacibacter aquimixticola TaxID=2489173 RepID=A0A4T3EZP9_9SPHN|nr:DUF2946 family protein [Alteraurantiacibacter aquimixticola]TIX50252.1 DUF2946 domain-containing protein [Alteraurantiacibacter aquimixticola]
MTARRESSHWMLLVAVALLLRAVVPQGWMLGEDASGAITVEVCNSDQVLVIPMKDDAPAHEDEETEAKACAFASLSDQGTTPDPNLRLPLPQLAAAAYDAVRQRVLSPDTPADLPPATGPPALA